MTELEEQKIVEDADAWLREHMDEFVQDIISIVNIRSVSTPGEGGYPFGSGTARVIDRMVELGEGFGLIPDNDAYYNVSFLLPGQTQREIGILSHLDVVPEGTGWTHDPFHAVVEDGYIVGRGARDNKGPCMTNLYIFRYLKEKGYCPKHTFRAMYGADEENGMRDMPHYRLSHECPDITLVSDGAWGVCIGEKGHLGATFRLDISDSNLVSFNGGEIKNAIPARACAVIAGHTAAELAALASDTVLLEDTAQGVSITQLGKAGHAAFPDTGINAIWKLAVLLQENGLVTGKAARAIDFLAECNGDPYGSGFHIDVEDDVSGRTTVTGSIVETHDGYLTHYIDSRYAIRFPQEEIEPRLQECAALYGAQLLEVDSNPPRYTPIDEDLRKLLIDNADKYIPSEHIAFTMGGGTHARKMLHALPYGPNDFSRPYKFGLAHTADEGNLIECLVRNFRAYLIALLKLDEFMVEGYDPFLPEDAVMPDVQLVTSYNIRKKPKGSQ